MSVLRGTIHDSLCIMHILRGILILRCFLQTGELLGDEGKPHGGWEEGPPRHSFHFCFDDQQAAAVCKCTYAKKTGQILSTSFGAHKSTCLPVEFKW
eukprot:scaffold2353_cov73-Skeletonema_marinoi.AAC.10